MPPSADDEFVSAADALYAVPAGAFVAARNARAKQARADGDRDLAARVTALPKPSAAAWLVNLLVREGDDGLERLLALGAEFRAAQDGGDGGRLRELGTRRRDLLAELTRTTSERAGQVDRAPSAAVLEEFQQTLQAVLVDEGAAAAVQTGRLVHGLTADGLDPADLTEAVGGPGSIGRPRRSAAPRRGPDDDGDNDDDEHSKHRAEAERRSTEAAGRAADARRAAEGAAERARGAEDALAQQDETVRDLASRLDELQRPLESARQALRTAADAADGARSAEQDALRAADDAEAEAAELRGALER